MANTISGYQAQWARCGGERAGSLAGRGSGFGLLLSSRETLDASFTSLGTIFSSMHEELV